MIGGDLLTLLDRIVEQTTPGEDLEAFGLDSTETTVRAHKGAIESLSSAKRRGIGIRVINGQRVGYSYTVDLSEPSLAAALDEARRNAVVGTPDPGNVLALGGDAEAVGGLYDAAIESTTPEQKVSAALELEAATRDGAAEITGTDVAMYGDETRTAAIASSKGVRGSYRRSDAYVLVEALAGRDGSTTSAMGLDVGRSLDAIDIRGAAAEAVERATRLLGGRKPAGARIPVVFDPMVSASFLGVLSGALTAEAVQRGRSLFADRVGDELAPANVQLIDDGRHPDGMASAPWDGEGTPTQRTVLLADGVLQGFLHNVASATREGKASTGNASRATYTSPPGVSPTNLYLQPGETSPEALLAEVGDAFYCQQVMGLHSGANPISGDFSVGAAGVMVRDGEMAEPVREATIAGSIPEMLARIAHVGDDLRFMPFGGGLGGLTLVIEGMTLAGA